MASLGCTIAKPFLATGLVRTLAEFGRLAKNALTVCSTRVSTSWGARGPKSGGEGSCHLAGDEKTHGQYG